MLNLEKARKELEEKNYFEIQKDTAWAWASRSCVSYDFVLEASKDQIVAAYVVAVEFEHEAIEHSALVEKSSSTLLKEIQEAIRPHQEKAIECIENLLQQNMEEKL